MSTDKEKGLCRRMPPQVIMLGMARTGQVRQQTSPMFSSQFAVIGKDRWCGEFRPKLDSMQ